MSSFFIEAIQSVFDQTYKNWELLLVDDGSTDGSTEIALRYTQKYPEKVHYLEHEGHHNRGMSATRNLGIRHAKGEYITFLDADDIWIPNTLEEQAAILNSHPDAGMVYGPIQIWFDWTGNSEDQKLNYLEQREYEELKKLGMETNTLIEPPILFLLLLQMKISIAGMLVRRQVIEKVGGFEDSFRGLYEDQVFCTKVCLQFPVFVASQCWYKYRQHPKSCCVIAQKTKKEYWHIQRPVFLNWLEQYLSIKGFKYTEAWEVLQKELWLSRHPILSSLLNRPQQIIKRIKWRVNRIALQKLLVKTEKLRI
ncbi:glycosyltransferase family A protein [Nostoc piscinale]|uniref:glycosyltransferase family A protein n=1 Tax=Nostoc piscinale TaxID=224012 RepID=UPI0019109ECF|nr:glycosyltransferase family A protein [Nostoc piscinale]